MTTHHSDDHPRRAEEEYFARQNAELIQQMRSELDEARLAAERQSHIRKCPRDGADLTEQSLGDVRVDACPECGGVWIDKGELDVIRKLRAFQPHDTHGDGPFSRVMHDILDMFHT